MSHCIEIDGDQWLSDVEGVVVARHPIPSKTGPRFERMLPDTIVMHYTAGGTVSGAIATWEDPRVMASAHFIVDRDGSVTQCVPVNRVAWHAGRSGWRAWTGEYRTGLNDYSIGIELVNPGRLTVAQYVGPGDLEELKTWYGLVWGDGAVFRDYAWWAEYTEKQIAAVVALVAALGRLLPDILDVSLQEIIGHSDITPRKQDPGPAFPMSRVMAALVEALQQPETAQSTPEAPEIGDTTSKPTNGAVDTVEARLPRFWATHLLLAALRGLVRVAVAAWSRRKRPKSGPGAPNER